MASVFDFCAGMFNQSVEQQRPDRQPDGAGGFTNDTWNTVRTLACRVTTIRGGEPFRQQRLHSQATHMFAMAYLSDIEETDRLVFKGDAYNIRLIENVEEANQYLVIHAERGVVD